MSEQAVVFKGTRNGLHIYLAAEPDISGILHAAEEKLQSGRPFFEGATVNLTFSGRECSKAEQGRLLELFSRYLNPGSVSFNSEPDLSPDVKEESSGIDYARIFNGLDEGMTRFIRGTVRSGQRIYYEGSIVIIGDVNPGGEVIAGGNILVLGALRGIAHAGAAGNVNAVVASYCLQPTQLRIAGFIARAPEGEAGKPPYPEVAYIRQGQLLIDPYLPGKENRKFHTEK
ncbi:MAG: septum site-determining protein MinC [Caldicoprobacterales bacterium]|jgi:septum site-determining protein MinC|nr:septum site-determining protein MinC [Clostridiales bacterium]